PDFSIFIRMEYQIITSGIVSILNFPWQQRWKSHLSPAVTSKNQTADLGFFINKYLERMESNIQTKLQEVSHDAWRTVAHFIGISSKQARPAETFISITGSASLKLLPAETCFSLTYG